MFAQFPQKAAAYGQHVISIITSTEADVLGEMRNQYERNGVSFKGMMDTAAEDAQRAAQSSGELVTNLADTAQETSNVVLDASSDAARRAS